MATLIDRLFGSGESDAIKSLWADESSRLLIQKEIGKKLLDTDEVIDELPLTQLMFLTSLSHFSTSEEECVNVASIIYWGFEQNDILPMVHEHRNKELAYRCLISLGFFKKALIRRYERYGAPRPSFYRQVGANTFESIGMIEVGQHFNQWESFLSEFFV